MFIEVTEGNETILINVDHVTRVASSWDKKTQLTILGFDDGDIRVEEDYETVKSMMRESGDLKDSQ